MLVAGTATVGPRWAGEKSGQKQDGRRVGQRPADREKGTVSYA